MRGRKECGCMCFNCACLGDCPYAGKHNTDCLYFLKSRVTLVDMSIMLGCSTRYVCTILENNADIIKGAFEKRGMNLLSEAAPRKNSKRTCYYLKIKYADRVLTVVLQQRKTAAAKKQSEERGGADRRAATD